MLTNSLRALKRVASGPGSVERLQTTFTRSVSNWQSQLVDIANTMEDGRPAPVGNRPARVTITGASGAIGYSLLFRIASGEMLGPDQPVILQLLELPEAMKRLEGTVMELQDGAFPLLKGIVATSDPLKAFDATDFALLVGASPRKKGQERKDLLFQNAAIFETQGKALNKVANRDTARILVVGNPANTNCFITYLSAPDIHRSRFTAMTRLDHNRGLAQIAQKANCDVSEISRFCIWGNHSSTQYPDVTYTTVKGKRLKDIVTQGWIETEFIPRVQKRGAEIIEARGSSSAASAADAAVQHMRDWVFGTKGEWTSMGIITPTNSYGVEPGTCFSFPVICAAGHYRIAPYIGIDKFSADRIEATRRELIEEATLLNSQQKL